jgi:hypothetical protein
MILQDAPVITVFSSGIFQGLYFHKSIGISCCKPRKVQQLFDYQIAKNNIEILNMLNVKYIIQKIKRVRIFPLLIQMPTVMRGLSMMLLVNKANDEMKLLDKIDTKRAAILMFTCMATSSKCTS